MRHGRRHILSAGAAAAAAGSGQRVKERTTSGRPTHGHYLGKHSRSLRRHERRPTAPPSYTHTHPDTRPRRSWGRPPRAATPGVAANSGPLEAAVDALESRKPGKGAVERRAQRHALRRAAGNGVIDDDEEM